MENYTLKEKKSIFDIVLEYKKKDVVSSNNIEDVTDFCSINKNFCKIHKNFICGHLLKIDDYKIPKNINPCHIYKELLIIHRKVNKKLESNSKTQNLKISNEAIKEEIRLHGSENLKKMCAYNNISLRRKRTSEDIFNDTDTVKLP